MGEGKVFRPGAATYTVTDVNGWVFPAVARNFYKRGGGHGFILISV